jgi:RNA polymerase subunit RPABC4/transcription elongation factor Spt4
MPHHEFARHICKKSLSKSFTIAEHDTEKVTCPHCASREVEQRWSALSSKKSA